MKRVIAFFFVLVSSLVALPSEAALRVVTTTTDLADIVGTIAGPLASVESITLGNQDPHYVQAKPSYMVRLNRADLVVSVGLELEVGWLPPLLQGARNPAILPGKPGFLEASGAVTPIEVPTKTPDRSRGDVHPLGNPHFWLDPDNGQRVAERIAKRLGDLDSANEAAYADGAKRFKARIDAARTRWQSALAPYKGKKVVSYHRTFNYFLRAFGLVPIGYVEERPGIPPGPSHAAELVRAMRAEKVRVLLHEQYFDRKTSDIIASKVPATVLVLPTSVGGVPAATDYESLIDHLVRSVQKALAERGS
jgi:zinc/manganese transport system substrate-binding protein